jgi:hypothetical protein
MTTTEQQEGEYLVTREDGVETARVMNRPPPVVVIPVIDTSKYIDKGPFFDRFGSAMMPILMSTDSTVVAIRVNLNARAWVDLALPSVAQSLAAIGEIIPALTPAIQSSILNTPVQPAEQYALIKLYF